MVRLLSRRMKDSGIEWIGEIPEDWEVINNKYLLDFIKGKNPSEITTDKVGLPYIGASDLDIDGDIHEYSNYCDEDLPKATREDTLILWDGARAGLIGIGHEGYISSTIVKVIPRVDYISKKFWYWYLKGFQPVMNDWVGGTTIPHMNRKFINEIYFLDFPTERQQKIASFLDKKVAEIDHILEKTSESIEEYKKYKQSIITEAVTKGLNPDVKMKDSGIEWIGEMPEHWDTIKLKYIFKIVKEIAGKEGFDILSVTQSGLKIKDISSNEGQIAADYSKYQLVNEGDYVMNHMDLLTGWIDCSMYSGVTSPDYRVFRPIVVSKLSPEYYRYLFQMCYSNKIFYGLGQGVSNLGRWRLQTEKFTNFILPSPPLKEQQEIADYIFMKITQINNLISQKNKLIENLEAYKKSLIYECVTGKREVV